MRATRDDVGYGFFNGLSEEDVDWVVGRLEHRMFEAGETILAEGDAPREIYVIQSGEADVFMQDERGMEHRLNRVGPGAGIGEMSFFTGRPVSATVRAVSDLVVVAMTKSEFRQIASTFPRLYENLGAALSERLVKSDRRSIRETKTHVTALVDGGGPPLLAYAVAASIAWHTAQPALLIACGGLSEELATLAREAPVEDADAEPRAYVAAASSLGGNLDEAVAKATTLFPHVVALVPDGRVTPAHTSRTLRLVGPHDSATGGTAGEYALRGWIDANSRRRPDTDRELRVPPLTAEDEQHLREGILPHTTAAGSAIGTAARDLAETRIGVALGGGAIRGWAHIGVLKGLERLGVPIDFIVGTSIGAIIASSYAFGHAPAETDEALYRASAKIFRVRVPRMSLLSSSGVRQALVKSFGDAQIEDTSTPLAITATDIVQQREIVLRKGLLWQAALASASIPGVFPPQQMGEYFLVDGGVVNPVPSNVLADMGANVLIGVKLMRSANASSRSRSNRPGLIEIFTSTFELMQSKITTEAASASTLLIEPSFAQQSGFGLRQFGEGRRFIPNGEAAVEAALPRLAASLPWLRSRHPAAVTTG